MMEGTAHGSSNSERRREDGGDVVGDDGRCRVRWLRNGARRLLICVLCNRKPKPSHVCSKQYRPMLERGWRFVCSYVQVPQSETLCGSGGVIFTTSE